MKKSWSSEEQIIAVLRGVVDDVHALYWGSQFLPARVQSFLDFMVPRTQTFLA